MSCPVQRGVWEAQPGGSRSPCFCRGSSCRSHMLAFPLLLESRHSGEERKQTTPDSWRERLVNRAELSVWGQAPQVCKGHSPKLVQICVPCCNVGGGRPEQRAT